jgi:hypothetical protein
MGAMTTRRQHSELLSRAEVKLGEAIAQLHHLGAGPSLIAAAVLLESRVSDLVDEKGEHGHFWNFDAERGGVRCSKCHRSKRTVGDATVPCTGDPMFIAVA